MLATLLDAAIEFRRRQLLAAAAADEGGAAGGDGAPSRFPGLGMLSRAGVAAWKARLLVAIDELERRAEACGIGAWGAGSTTMPRCQAQDASSFASLLLPACSSPALFDCAAAMHWLTANATLPTRLHLPQTRPRSPRPPLPESRRRFSPGKDANDELAAAEGGKPAAAGGLRSHSPSAACLAPGEEEEEESQSQRLGRTVEQLRELVQQGGELNSGRQAGAQGAGLTASRDAGLAAGTCRLHYSCHAYRPMPALASRQLLAYFSPASPTSCPP